ncbi:MAG: hypothetical protein P8125_14230 [Gemmatimonadota bacterium]
MRIVATGLARVAAGAVILAGAVAGCTQRSEPPPVLERTECRKGGAPPSGLESLEGAFELWMSADNGSRNGYEAKGRLTLNRRDSVDVPFYGWTTLDPEQVGAHRLGDPASRDPDAPGVLVLANSDSPDSDGSSSIVLRLGSQANRSDIVRFDGAFTALYVRWIEENGFGGDWASGIRGPEVAGEFCAVRSPWSG